MNLNKSDSDTSPRIKFSFFSSRYKENSVDRVDCRFVSLIIDMICIDIRSDHNRFRVENIRDTVRGNGQLDP